MKHLKVFVSLVAFVAIFVSSNISAYSSDASSSFLLRSVSQEEIRNDALEEYAENKIALVADGKTDFKIIIADDCSKPLSEAAEVLRDVLKKMSGADIPVIRESRAKFSKNHIFIGKATHNISVPDTAADGGYVTDVNDDNISICGADDEGTRNGIYGFIEDKLGCMFLTGKDTYIPKHKSVFIEKGRETDAPATKWRDVYSYETAQNKWAAKLRLNGIDIESDDKSLSIEQLQYEGWGTWCHNCYDFLSPDEYFESHPEYFSEKNGKRVTSYDGRDAYLCLSNPEVFEIVKHSLSEKIAANPDKMYWDFSGNDNSSLAGCECDKCKAADKAAGGTGMGTLLPFLNKLARAFPDKYISTLAYLHTLKAPDGIKAEPNVVIKLCAMPGDQASSYMDGGNSNSNKFKSQVEAWSKITDKIVVWDYVVNFAHLLMPFPNFAVQQKNQKFYEDNNIIGVFHQASREKGGEFANLRAYVLSKLMWHGSTMDVAECISRYIAAYFGNAAPKMIEYMNLCMSSFSSSKKPLGLYDGLIPHFRSYLSDENVERYQHLIDEAKALVKDDASIKSRLEEVEISVAYAKVIQPRISEEERRDALNRLNELCKKNGIAMVCEWDSLDHFNSVSLKGIISSEKKTLIMPYILITASVVGVIIIAAVAVFAVKIIPQRKKEKA